MDEFGQVTVNGVALISVIERAGDDETFTLNAAIGVWADLQAVRERCQTEGWSEVPDQFTVVDAYLMPDRSRIALVTVAEPDEADNETAAGYAHAHTTVEDTASAEALEVDTEVTQFTFILPVNAVGLVAALSVGPVRLLMMLIDGPPPKDLTGVVIEADQIEAEIDIDANVTYEALKEVVPIPQHVPLVYATTPLNGPIVSMRALMWSLFAGTALGQPASLRQLSDFGMWAENLIKGDNPDTERYEAVIQVATIMQASSREAFENPITQAGSPLLPSRMLALSGDVERLVPPELMDALMGGEAVPCLLGSYPLASIVAGVGVVSAARAVLFAEEDGRVTPTYLLGDWLNGEDPDDDPVWIIASTLEMVLHGDTAVLTNLLSILPNEENTTEASEFFARVVHTLAEAVLGMDVTTVELLETIDSLDVHPSNYDDVKAILNALISEGLELMEGETQQCPACAGQHTVLTVGWEVPRLAAAVAASFPVLADAIASDAELVIGEVDWVSAREAYLRHWLTSISE